MKYLIVSFLFLIASAHVDAGKIPLDHSGDEFKIQTTIYKKISPNKVFLISLENFNRLEKRKTQSFYFELSNKLNAHLNLYLGYEKKYGERFDEDWVKVTDGWSWNDTQSRGVNWWYLGFNYKTKLEILPGKNWRFNIKSGFKYNFLNSQNTFQLNPSFTFFEYKDAKLYRSYFWQTDMFYGLNFAKNNIYRWYSYLGVMFHLKPGIAIGGFVGKSFYRWFSTEVIETKIKASYHSTNTSNIAGIRITLTI